MPKAISCRVSSGAMLIMLTKVGARTLLEHWKTKEIKQNDPDYPSKDETDPAKMYSGSIWPGHFDCELKKFLKGHWAIANFKYCYVFPPIGNYTTHPSGCDPKFAETGRPSCWNCPWVCQGTRRAEDVHDREKFLVKFTLNGHADWITTKKAVEPEDEVYTWYTEWAGPGNPPLLNERWQKIMGQNDYRVKLFNDIQAGVPFAIANLMDQLAAATERVDEQQEVEADVPSAAVEADVPIAAAEEVDYGSEEPSAEGEADVPMAADEGEAVGPSDTGGPPETVDEPSAAAEEPLADSPPKKNDRERRLRSNLLHLRSFRFWHQPGADVEKVRLVCQSHTNPLVCST